VAPAPPPASDAADPAGGDAAPPKPAVDPMQWWGALTQQFTDLATRAMQDSSAIAARNLAAAAPPAAAAKGKAPARARRSAAAPAPGKTARRRS
jgi:hypothetical protein